MPEVDTEGPTTSLTKPGRSAAGRPAVCFLVLAEDPIFRSGSLLELLSAFRIGSAHPKRAQPNILASFRCQTPSKIAGGSQFDCSRGARRRGHMCQQPVFL